MNETLADLRHRIQGVRDLLSVVQTMKAMAAAMVGPCENALAALADYRRAVERGLAVCFRGKAPSSPPRQRAARTGVIAIGTDQGMVGQFNETLAGFISSRLPRPGDVACLWVVGERLQARLDGSGHAVTGTFATPNSVNGITPLVSDLLLALERENERGGLDGVRLFHNQPGKGGTYQPECHHLLPLDEEWRRNLAAEPWPGPAIPEIIAGGQATLDTLVREFLFVSLFATCAASMAAENARRFAAMQGAEHNINERLGGLTLGANRRRQAAIDEELFDLLAGYEVLRERRER